MEKKKSGQLDTVFDQEWSSRVSWVCPRQEVWQVPWSEAAQKGSGLSLSEHGVTGTFSSMWPAMNMSCNHRILQELKRMTKKIAGLFQAVGKTPVASILLCASSRSMDTTGVVHVIYMYQLGLYIHRHPCATSSYVCPLHIPHFVHTHVHKPWILWGSRISLESW